MKNKSIEIFFACDDAFIKYTVVSLTSIIENASRDFHYNVHVLCTEVGEKNARALLDLQNENFHVEFNNVTPYLENLAKKLPLRDYYSKTTYFRMFIADMFKDVDKAIYIDSDTVVNGDISELYNTDIKDNLVGACHEQVMLQVDVYGTYAEKVVGVSRQEFFNAGLILINCKAFRERKILEKFMKVLAEYKFVVTQDEDYLNLLCRDWVYWLDQRWNTVIFGDIPHPIEEAKILHYIMTSKPWHYIDCRHGEYFWKYAKKTSVYGDIISELNGYTDEKKERDRISGEKLLELAISEINKEDNYQNIQNKKKNPERVRVFKKISEFERIGLFDEDVENDPPTIPLSPEKVNFLNRGIIAKIKRHFAFLLARVFFKKAQRQKKIILADTVGAENIKKCKNAIITCNHFNPLDSFVMQYVFDDSRHTGKMYRVIREGNYTSFPGFYGFLMRNCNTLPLSSKKETLHLFLKACDKALSKGNCILIYPEQSMWYNYRKPKPHKSGGFDIAVRNNVPVVPCFITLKDSDYIDENGYPVQIYTPHVGEPIYPDQSLSRRERSLDLMNKNYEYFKKVYEEYYQIPLVYDTEPSTQKQKIAAG